MCVKFKKKYLGHWINFVLSSVISFRCQMGVDHHWNNRLSVIQITLFEDFSNNKKLMDISWKFSWLCHFWFIFQSTIIIYFLFLYDCQGENNITNFKAHFNLIENCFKEFTWIKSNFNKWMSRFKYKLMIIVQKLFF